MVVLVHWADDVDNVLVASRSRVEEFFRRHCVADTATGQLYRFNISTTRSCSHASSPTKVGNFIYSSSNHDFNT